MSRKLLPEGITIEDEEFDVKLLEVTEDDAPNVLTNDPEFFSQIKKGEFLLKMKYYPCKSVSLEILSPIRLVTNLSIFQFN